MTFNKSTNLKEAAESIIAGDDEKSYQVACEALANGVDAREFLDAGLIPGMDEVGVRFRDGDMFLPEVLLAARAMKSAMTVLQPELSRAGAQARGKVVIGTVEGDVHDIGKNIVISMLEGAGFQVIDLGTNVPSETFITQIKEHQPDILCMSALLTTTMPAMKEVIDLLETNRLKENLKVVVGGAPVTENFAREIKADSYAEDANATVAFCKKCKGLSC
jgi:5-methyltetrahydrofolate--homocysteine methyltransferase